MNTVKKGPWLLPGKTLEPINDALKDHALGVEGWAYSEFARPLHEWAERFNEAFDLQLETPAIRLDRAGRRTLGTYLPGRNSFGLRHEVTLNTRHLDRSLPELLETLLHELLHEWQELHGRPGKSNYHNKEFREKARSLGLIVDQWGHGMGVLPGPFTSLLEENGVNPQILSKPKVAGKRPPGKSKLKKWSCRCTNVRAAVELKAKCLHCGQIFRRAEGA
jgi:hypothetical protein